MELEKSQRTETRGVCSHARRHTKKIRAVSRQVWRTSERREEPRNHANNDSRRRRRASPRSFVSLPMLICGLTIFPLEGEWGTNSASAIPSRTRAVSGRLLYTTLNLSSARKFTTSLPPSTSRSVLTTRRGCGVSLWFGRR